MKQVDFFIVLFCLFVFSDFLDSLLEECKTTGW